MSRRNRALPSLSDGLDSDSDASSDASNGNSVHQRTTLSTKQIEEELQSLSKQLDENEEKRELPPLPSKPKQLRRLGAPKPSPLRRSPSIGQLAREEEKKRASHREGVIAQQLETIKKS